MNIIFAITVRFIVTKDVFFEERKPYLNKNGYYYITVWKINKHITYRLHRLVAKYFVSNPNNYDVVNHIDGNKKIMLQVI